MAAVLKNKRNIIMVGIDIFLPYLKEAQQQGSYDACVLCDIHQIPIRPKSFDVVLSMDVLEHLEKEDGLGFINAIEQIANRQVIITTPVGIYETYAYDGNPHQVHKYIWQIEDLKQLGYTVRGCGLRNIGGETGVRSRLPPLLRPLMDIIGVVAGPITYFLPRFAGGIVAVKNF